MRAITQIDRSSLVASEDKPSTRADLKRRRFLLTLGVGGAGAAAIAARSITTGTAVTHAPDTVSDDGGYAATAHVQTYYKTARL